MSKKGNQVWKDFLLSSGLPLEHFVKETLEALGAMRPEEYKYERVNELGVPTLFSIDVYASRMLEPLWLDLFIECKYRHDGTRWIFTPDQFGDPLGPEFQDTFIVLDNLVQGFQIDKTVLRSYSSHYSLCYKGVELLPNSFNPKSIEQSIHQLRFAVADKAAENLEHQIDKLLVNDFIFVLLPIVVTTADLWRINHGITMQDIRSATNIEDVATPKDILMLHKKPDNELRRHTKERLTKRFNSDQIKRMDEQLKVDDLHGFEFFVSYFATYYPSVFVIINHRKFKDAMANVIKFFQRSDVIKSK